MPFLLIGIYLSTKPNNRAETGRAIKPLYRPKQKGTKTRPPLAASLWADEYKGIQIRTANFQLSSWQSLPG